MMKVTINKWTAVATWRWDFPTKFENEDDSCGICSNPFDAACAECKYPGDDCPLGTACFVYSRTSLFTRTR